MVVLGIRAWNRFAHQGVRGISPAAQKPLNEELAPPPGVAASEGTGIVVLVDTSGSMRESVPDAAGGKTEKIEIARMVTRKTLDEIRAYASKNPGKKVFVGLTQFSSGPSQLFPLGPVEQLNNDKVNALRAEGDTAIGEALVSGKKELNQAGLKKQYMVVITDGENTNGRSPEDVVRALNHLPEAQRATIYLVAFDVKAKVFQPLIDQGVLVAEAQNASSLQSALDYILYQKILVEQE